MKKNGLNQKQKELLDKNAEEYANGMAIEKIDTDRKKDMQKQKMNRRSRLQTADVWYQS